VLQNLPFSNYTILPAVMVVSIAKFCFLQTPVISYKEYNPPLKNVILCGVERNIPSKLALEQFDRVGVMILSTSRLVPLVARFGLAI